MDGSMGEWMDKWWMNEWFSPSIVSERSWSLSSQVSFDSNSAFWLSQLCPLLDFESSYRSSAWHLVLGNFHLHLQISSPTFSNLLRVQEADQHGNHQQTALSSSFLLSHRRYHRRLERGWSRRLGYLFLERPPCGVNGVAIKVIVTVLWPSHMMSSSNFRNYCPLTPIDLWVVIASCCYLEIEITLSLVISLYPVQCLN